MVVLSTIALLQNMLLIFSSKAKSKTYHYNKWKLCCFDEGVTLLSIYDFYWIQEQKQEIYKSKLIIT